MQDYANILDEMRELRDNVAALGEKCLESPVLIVKDPNLKKKSKADCCS